MTTTPALAMTAPVGGRRKRGRPRDDAADGRILESALELILQHGFDAMTVDDVAARAGVGKATVYRRWARKEDLAVAAMEELCSAALPVPDHGDLRTDLRSAYGLLQAFLTTERGAAYLRTSVAESVRQTRIAAIYRRVFAQAESVAACVLRRAVARGELRADLDVDSAVRMLGGAVLMPALTGRGVPSAADVDGVVEMLLRGAAA